MRRQIHLALICISLLAGASSFSQTAAPLSPRIIELTADRDSRYRQSHKTSPTIEVSAGELLILRITAIRADQVARDGSVHGLALLDKNSNAVPGWRFFLHPGVQDLAVAAPSEAGRYTAVCTVICSEGHDGMGFTVLVTDRKASTKE
jgi:hypothetical protein